MTKSITAKHISEALEFRHACKKFDLNKKISEYDLELLLQAARLAPSSYGMEQGISSWRRMPSCALN